MTSNSDYEKFVMKLGDDLKNTEQQNNYLSHKLEELIKYNKEFIKRQKMRNLGPAKRYPPVLLSPVKVPILASPISPVSPVSPKLRRPPERYPLGVSPQRVPNLGHPQRVPVYPVEPRFPPTMIQPKWNPFFLSKKSKTKKSK